MLTAALIGSLSPAHACGGFFCGNTPVDQQGEDILFAVDPERDETTVHVQISYTGPAEEFAWILPVATEPQLALSSDALFRELGWRTQPQFGLAYEEVGACDSSSRYWGSYSDYAVADSGGTSSSAPSEGVTVVSQSTVGPYETVVLQAESSEALLGWLSANSFNLPDTLDFALAPYIADDAYFVALKLRKDADTGALQPLALTYPGTGASIPIQLTSIAATPDMRLHVYMVGEKRAVPDSYLHVKIDDLVVDWWTAGSNYEDVITIAANEAGGQAFATDYAGSSSVMKDVLWSEGRYNIAALAAMSDPITFFDGLLSQGFVGDSQLLAMFREFLPMPQALVDQGIDEQSFYNCLSCYESYVATIPFDAPAFAAAIDERIVTPIHEAQLLLDAHPSLTRMTSSVSPIEMTVDPTFVFNPDMVQIVEPLRSATVVMYCTANPSWDEAPRRLVLADGRAYNLPSEQWFRENETTEHDYLEGLMDHYAIVIEDTSATGEPVVLADWTDDARAAAEAFNDAGDVESPKGCGCSSSSGLGLGAWGFGLLLVSRRRARG